MPVYSRAEFVWLIVEVGKRTGASVTSWLRSKPRNERVGGAFQSQHLTGTAVDLVFDTPEQRTAAVSVFKFFGLDVIEETDHVHVELP